MRVPFDPEQADFAAMTTGGKALAIGAVRHQAFVEVNEEGTEAAAATAVVVDLTAAPPDPVALTIDRPHLFWIVDEPTGAAHRARSPNDHHGTPAGRGTEATGW